MEILQQIWPISAWLLGLTVASIWWAATQTQRINQLEEKAKSHATHGEEIVLLKSSIDHLASRVGDLLDEIRAANAVKTRK